jgi:DNA-binding NarL/FixJ family response regulator
MQRIRLVIAEARTLFRQGLAALLAAEPDFDIVGEAGDTDEVRRVCSRVHPDLILLDAALPDPATPDGLAIISGLRVLCPQAAIVVLGEAGSGGSSGLVLPESETDTAAQAERRRALQLGAAACLQPSIDHEELIRALRTALTAQHCQDSAEEEVADAESAEAGHRRREGRQSITVREKAVIGLVAQGLCNKEIAHRLGIRTQTVKNHVSHLLEKLALADRTQLALYALQQGEFHA